MKLNVDDQRSFEKVSEAQLREAVSGLGSEEFVILSRYETNFIQMYRYDDGELELGYREGSAERHFNVKNSITLDEALAAFTAYLNEHFESWRAGAAHIEWERVEFNDSDEEMGLTHYVLDGEEYARVRVGSETPPLVGACSECSAQAREHHEEGCELEECPRCRGVSVDCDCD